MLSDWTNGTKNLTIKHCSSIGQLAYFVVKKDIPRDRFAITCEGNFVVCINNPVLSEPLSSLAGFASAGANNALWLLSKPLTLAERSAGGNAFLPGPLLKAAPNSEGSSTPQDPLKRYRLKRGQPAATMASDGGPVGVRTEYFPEIPAIPPEFFQ